MSDPNRLTSSHLQSPARPGDLEDRFSSPFAIDFRHPGYQGLDDDFLFSLPCFDTASGVTGLHYGTAHTACAIIANNAFDGYLTATRDGPRLDFHYDDLLNAREYWFHVPRPEVVQDGQEQASETSIAQRMLTSPSPYCYPVVPSFADWQFPHQFFDRWPGQDVSRYHLENWGPARPPPPLPMSPPLVIPTSLSQVSAIVRLQGPECRVSGAVEYVELAHIIPAVEEDWFTRNAMRRYGRVQGIYGLGNANNRVALRPDLHKAFDDHRIAIVPKCGALTVHFLDHLPYMAQQFHNRKTHSIEYVPVPWLLSRFALAVIPLTSEFLGKSIPRKLVRWNSDRSTYVEEVVPGDQCAAAARGFKSPKSRSQSPKKRTRSSATGDSIGYESEVLDYDTPEERQTKRARLDEYLAHTEDYSTNTEEVTPPDGFDSAGDDDYVPEEAQLPDLSHSQQTESPTTISFDLDHKGRAEGQEQEKTVKEDTGPSGIDVVETRDRRKERGIT